MSAEIDGPRVQQVIVSRQERRGAGTPADPVRRITQVFDFDGTLIAQRDEYRDAALELGMKHVAGEVHHTNGCPFCEAELARGKASGR